ncbi:GNAT family N-acetyltransferase [Deinococcus maricopensis]|uniref:GCN5-related N-acetyltransferase n=1 Tax=Deinococcus maricopensis (strain DSM 21211 / LMG 22137 / NRRL B-23946 / LB-34) TaxID=709986 RepID=E8U4X6_DEIML|nr:GNAT family N-acetyltransferase [Deinococcus maricopensis]ADV66115.1 GCN5-related N-acetyltransferase [Deinococcus maricopensis DSM 21211]
MTPFRLRPATPEDAPAIAHVHVTSWRETYAGLMPGEFLERLTNDAARAGRTRMWTDLLNAGQDVIFVAVDAAGEVVAFASGGAARDLPGVSGELQTLYSVRAAQGHGLGRALTRAVADALHERGHTNLGLWVLASNPTRGFYAHLGGQEAGHKVEAVPGGELHEVALVWPDLTALRRA